MSVQYSCFNCGVNLDEDHKVRYIGDAAMPICDKCNTTTHTVVTNACPMCSERSHITVARKEFETYLSGTLIQDAMPSLSAAQREMLMTGTHPECWDEMWADLSED